LKLRGDQGSCAGVSATEFTKKARQRKYGMVENGIEEKMNKGETHEERRRIVSAHHAENWQKRA
jgi:hypothetical protein